jgi:hypothetical protein
MDNGRSGVKIPMGRQDGDRKPEAGDRSRDRGIGKYDIGC